MKTTLLVMAATTQLWCADVGIDDADAPWIEIDRQSGAATFHWEEAAPVEIDRSELRFDQPDAMIWNGETFRPCDD